MTDPTIADTLIRIEGRAGRITLNRPRALNALTYPQLGAIAAALDAWERDASVELVILDAAGAKAFCAGGDVRALYDAHTAGPDFARTFWRDEYRLNARIANYPKPYVAIMDGVVMGGGVGISAHGRHRIVTERTSIAMPETAIGLIPDVGGTWLLARAGGELGVYLGLTGQRFSGSDAIQLGFADAHVPSAAMSQMVARLTDAGSHDAPLDIIEAHETGVPQSALIPHRAAIDRWFAGATVEAILAELQTTTDPLARDAHATLKDRSPTALKLALRAIRQARHAISLEAALATEYRLVTRLYEQGEFIEGVRALIVDKDKAPKWRPASLAEVTPEIIDAFFAELPADVPQPFPGL
jgi:enoyl-CoA hydratase